MDRTGERVAAMEAKIENLQDRADKMERLLTEVGDIAKSTKIQLLVGVGVIVTVLNLITKFL